MGGVPLILIIYSYVLILHTVFYLPSKDAWLKTLGTCGSNVCVILVSYVPGFCFLTHNFEHCVAPHVQIFVANTYILLPAMVNSIIYGIRTKKIQDRFLKFFIFQSLWTKSFLVVSNIWKNVVLSIFECVVSSRSFFTCLKSKVSLWEETYPKIYCML